MKTPLFAVALLLASTTELLAQTEPAFAPRECRIYVVQGDAGDFVHMTIFRSAPFIVDENLARAHSEMQFERGDLFRRPGSPEAAAGTPLAKPFRAVVRFSLLYVEGKPEIQAPLELHLEIDRPLRLSTLVAIPADREEKEGSVSIKISPELSVSALLSCKIRKP
jgi:hypothetical protein